MTIQMEIKYEAGHSYCEEWERIDYFCPACGAKDVWHETSVGDYYVGEEHMCRKCGASFYIPNLVAKPKQRDWQHEQRLSAIRSVND